MSAMNAPRIGILHYSVAPIVGGVENVIQAHAKVLLEMRYAVTLIAGEGSQDALPSGGAFIRIPEMSTNNPEIVNANKVLAQGGVPANFEATVSNLQNSLRPVLRIMDHVIIHNIFTKHFNLALTVALLRLFDQGAINHCIAWCHDISWTSSHSRQEVFPGYPWDLMRTYHPQITYVTVSERRQHELAELFKCQTENIQVVYNGVDPKELLGLSTEASDLIEQLGLWDADLNLLMPVRITEAKNIELGIQVVAALKRRNIQTRLIVTGPPDPHDQKGMAYYQSLQTMRQELDVIQEMRFVFESGPQPERPYFVDMRLVGDLFRVCDALFMPSHREGFGMPVLEAGLARLPVFSTETPAAEEVGKQDVIIFPADASAQQIADLILDWTEYNQVYRLHRRVRKNYTWRGIFHRKIHPLLDEKAL
jgi:glycosyltransferase involved in cell wall biosynthesis